MKPRGLTANRLAVLFCALLLTSLLAPGISWAQPSHSSPLDSTSQYRALSVPAPDARQFVPGEVLVKLAPDQHLSKSGGKLSASNSVFAQALTSEGLTDAVEIAPGTYKLSGPNVDVAAAVRHLQATGGVSYAGPNHLYHEMLTPNDEQYNAGQQWGVTQIKAEQAWDVTTGSNNIVIAILDTGTATDHPDLEGKIVGGWNIVNNSNRPYDDNGHGTYTAGIAAAESNNGRGVVGISWGARIMPVKVLTGRGSGSEEDIAAGIRWAVDHGARIINASLGGEFDSEVMRDAVKYAADHNVLVVAASGNTPNGNPNYPAAYDSVLAVGATGRSDTFTGFSSWGPYVDVTAPGVGILSTAWDNGSLTYEYGNGTSASCPFVSGVAALVLSVNPSLTAAQVKQIIEDSSDDFGNPGWDEHYGFGRLNAAKAVQMAQAGPPPPHTPTPVPQASNTPAPTGTIAPSQPPAITLNDAAMAPGALLSIQGAGFAPNEIIDLSLATADGKSAGIGNAQTNGQGAFRAEVAVPRDTPGGSATITAAGSKSGLRASASFMVTGGTGGRSRVQGTIKGAVLGTRISVSLKPETLNGGKELTTTADPSGTYSFSGLAADVYSITANAPGYLPVGPFVVQVDGTPNDSKTLDFGLSVSRPAAFERVPAVPNSPTRVYFGPVGHTLGGVFLKFWQSHGGLAIFGYPISEEFDEVSATDGKTYKVQYFERNRFEYHPEFAGTPNEVLMGLLGVDSTKGRTFQPGAPIQPDATHAYFKETQHTLSGPFLKYWQSHGGLAVFGYPISEELTENGYKVQYFERNRFEYHPEFAGTPNEVLLGLLGVETAKRSGWINP